MQITWKYLQLSTYQILPFRVENIQYLRGNGKIVVYLNLVQIPRLSGGKSIGFDAQSCTDTNPQAEFNITLVMTPDYAVLFLEGTNINIFKDQSATILFSNFHMYPCTLLQKQLTHQTIAEPSKFHGRLQGLSKHKNCIHIAQLFKSSLHHPLNKESILICHHKLFEGRVGCYCLRKDSKYKTLLDS